MFPFSKSREKSNLLVQSKHAKWHFCSNYAKKYTHLVKIKNMKKEIDVREKCHFG